MELIILGSNSKGNGYILSNGEEAIILECGIRVSDALKEVEFNSKIINGVFVTHRHGDHSKYIGEYLRYFNVYTNYDTIEHYESKKRTNARNPIPMTDIVKVGNFTVTSFNVNHDVPAIGYYIHHPDCGNVLFLTDSTYVDYEFQKLNHVIIEANFSQPLMLQRVYDGDLNHFRYNRTISSHMGIDDCIKLLSGNDLSFVQNIVLIHLSSENSDSNMFKMIVEESTGIPTTIAKKGVKINFKNF